MRKINIVRKKNFYGSYLSPSIVLDGNTVAILGSGESVKLSTDEEADKI